MPTFHQLASVSPERSSSSDEIRQLYPDLTAAGGLGALLQLHLRSPGSLLSVSQPIEFIVYARIESGQRSSQVYIAANVRLFLFDFWSKGVILAHGATPDIAEVAHAINRWVGSNCATSVLASNYGFVAVKQRRSQI